MDFLKIGINQTKKSIEVYPDFKVMRSKDLMIKAKNFYAIWDEEAGMWSTDEYRVQTLVDSVLYSYVEDNLKYSDVPVVVKSMGDFSTKSWSSFKNYMNCLSDNAKELDSKLTFLDTVVSKNDYVSKRLPYSLTDGSIDAYEELMSTLYAPQERQKIEWAIGSVISGASKQIQKFVVLYGEAGTGKSTVLNIIQKIFDGYYTTFEAKALAGTSNAFATEAFKSNPLVAIQHDGDLSRIDDNTKLNSIISHEEMTVNEKYKPSYTTRINCMLFMGTNKPVMITDAKSGIIRRLIDVSPTGNRVSSKKYNTLIEQINFEIGAIAKHCLNVYSALGKNYYSSYKPIDMMFRTDVFFNFVEDSYFVFKRDDGVSLVSAYEMYKEYCNNSGIERTLPKHKFRDELKNYFSIFENRARTDQGRVRNYYSGFLCEKFEETESVKDPDESYILLQEQPSLLDSLYPDARAQYATKDGTPKAKWSTVETTLKDLDTSELHYVQLPPHHIVIDFDLKDEKGEKNLKLNIDAASKFPKTYSEVSKSGKGLHLHYIYDGDAETLSRLYSEGIEIKVFVGNSSLRRRRTLCNNIPVAHISSGLPKGERKMINTKTLENEKHLRALIEKALRKKVHPNTRPSIDFIFTVLQEAYDGGMNYDVTDLRPTILNFALESTNQAEYCTKTVLKMRFKSEEHSIPDKNPDRALVFYDVEVYPNLFLVNWKYQGPDQPITRMINPSKELIEDFVKMNLIGFNCRRYDNHILYAALLGYDNARIYEISQKIISGSKNAFFSEAYNISYTDVYDFSSDKKSLKQWEIDLGIHHKELEYPWDEPVPENKWMEVAEYCDNDVYATEAVFNHLEHSDFSARKILAALSGLSVNDTTNKHTTKIIFGEERNPQSQFNYTNLSTMFKGYKFENGKSTYRGEETGEGGYVYAEPGIHKNVALLDVASMHPTSIEILELFGPIFTKRFSELKQARLNIKYKDFEAASKMFGGKLAQYLDSPEEAHALAYALKIAINSVYGLTTAKFDNKFRDPRNKDNIVAKIGALFMVDLKHAVQDQGYQVVHIKTDSIKIANADEYIIQFVMDYGASFGYTFEHEATYERMCLANDAVYIARYLNDEGKAGDWTATGAQFAHPFVFKTLFTKEKIEFEDLVEAKSVTTALYLDKNENLSDGEHRYSFIGRTGAFVPVLPGTGGGYLYRKSGEHEFAFATGAKGYRWKEAEVVKELGLEKDVDYSYYHDLVSKAVRKIEQYEEAEWFFDEQ